MSKKVIFLDFDGVLNSTQTYKQNNGDRLFYGRKSHWSLELLMKSVVSHYDFYKIQLLKSICFSTDAEIVGVSAEVTSKYYPLVDEVFVNMGLPIVDAISSEYGRANAIQTYLMDHDVERFIVLDDEIFMGYEDFWDFVVKTDFYNEGLTEELAEEAVMILGPKKHINLK